LNVARLGPFVLLVRTAYEWRCVWSTNGIIFTGKNRRTLERLFSPVFRLSPTSIVPPMLQIFFISSLLLSERQADKTWNPQRINAFSDMGKYWTK
jgi:hypothetical protein